jgi:hypothetical protein
MLDWIALAILIVIFGLVIFGLVAVWGIPYDIAKARNHPHQDAIGVATVVSIFTLGALWPLLWIWAMTYRPDRGWGFGTGPAQFGMSERVEQLETRIAALEKEQQNR